MHKADFHLHSSNSPDAVSSLEEIVQAAIFLGLDEIAVTDHFDVCRRPRPGWQFDARKYFKEFKSAKKKFGGKILLRSGVEIGQPHVNPVEAEKLLAGNSFDFVLGSVHNLSDDRDIHLLGDLFSDSREIYRQYLEETEKTIRWGKFDVLAHITYPERYIFAATGERVDYSPMSKDFSDCLKLLIESGKGLEINTSGLRRPVRRLSPEGFLLKLYRDSGGEIVTIGSDAHSENDVGKGFFEAAALLRETGFRAYAAFQNRRPVFYDL